MNSADTGKPYRRRQSSLSSSADKNNNSLAHSNKKKKIVDVQVNSDRQIQINKSSSYLEIMVRQTFFLFSFF